MKVNCIRKLCLDVSLLLMTTEISLNPHYVCFAKYIQLLQGYIVARLRTFYIEPVTNIIFHIKHRTYKIINGRIINTIGIHARKVLH